MPQPVLVQVRDLGGKAPDLHTLGFSGATVPYNVGLLVRVVGKVASHGSGQFLLADSTGATVVVYSDESVSDGVVVGATGVCGLENGACVLRTKTADDVVSYSA